METGEEQLNLIPISAAVDNCENGHESVYSSASVSRSSSEQVFLFPLFFFWYYFHDFFYSLAFLINASKKKFLRYA